MRDFSEACSGVGGLQPFNRAVEAFGDLADDEGRSAAFARDVFLPDAGGRRRDDFPQQGARRLRFRSVLGQHLVDQHGVGAELPDIGVLAVIGVFRRGDHQADHERGERREEAGAEADGFLGSSLEQSAGKPASGPCRWPRRSGSRRRKPETRRSNSWRHHSVMVQAAWGRAAWGMRLLHIGVSGPGLPATICCGAADQPGRELKENT